MTKDPPDTDAALPEDPADLLVHLARLAQSGANSPLTAAQWTALRYFARANPASRTPSAFSEFHATTRGTASQTVRALVGMGLLARHVSESDGRSARIDVTEAGHSMLSHDPLADLRAALARLPQAEQTVLGRAVRLAARELATARGAPTFGTCVDCRHCERDAGTAYCHCTQTMLEGTDMAAFCIDYSPMDRVG